MSHEKINILFDVSSIAEGFSSRNFSRCGIYWVAYNLLWQFIKSPKYKITLLFLPCTLIIKKRISKHFQCSNNYITFYDKDQYNNKIKLLKNKIINTRNIIKICYYILKIIKNKLYLSLSKRFTKQINNFDIFFSPKNCIPDEIRSNISIKSFQILYDCIPNIFIDLYPFIDINHWYIKVTKSLNRETYYFCISDCTKSDFLRIFPDKLDKEKMFVTHIAPSIGLLQQDNKEILFKVLQKYNVNIVNNACYILSLCTIEPRKNLVFTVKCFIEFIKKHHIENIYFFLVGGHFPGYIEQFKKELSEFSEYQDKIILFGYVDDADVNILYSNSLFHICLSQYEGFGMTVLEAMQAGTPVICSDNSSLPEVVGDAAIKIPYDDETSCVKAMEELYFSEGLRKEYINKGLERAKLFSWERTFNKIDDVITRSIS